MLSLVEIFNSASFIQRLGLRQWSKFEPDKHPGYYAEAMARAEADARQGKAASSAESIESYLTAQKADSVKTAAHDSNVPGDRISAPASGKESKEEGNKEIPDAAATERETDAAKDASIAAVHVALLETE